MPPGGHMHPAAMAAGGAMYPAPPPRHPNAPGGPPPPGGHHLYPGMPPLQPYHPGQQQPPGPRQLRGNNKKERRARGADGLVRGPGSDEFEEEMAALANAGRGARDKKGGRALAADAADARSKSAVDDLVDGNVSLQQLQGKVRDSVSYSLSCNLLRQCH